MSTVLGDCQFLAYAIIISSGFYVMGINLYTVVSLWGVLGNMIQFIIPGHLHGFN